LYSSNSLHIRRAAVPNIRRSWDISLMSSSSSTLRSSVSTTGLLSLSQVLLPLPVIPIVMTKVLMNYLCNIEAVYLKLIRFGLAWGHVCCWAVPVSWPGPGPIPACGGRPTPIRR